MSFTIPDRAITYPFQSRWFESDVAIIGMSAGGKNGVIAGGCEVTESAIPDGNTLVSVGQVVVDGGLVEVAGQTVGHDVADALLPRFDLVVAYDDGTCASLAGTPDAAPLPPLPDTDSIALAQVFIPAADTAIEDEQIRDKRVFVPSPIAASEWITLSCAANLARANTAVQTADPVMQFTMSASGKYRVRGHVAFLLGSRTSSAGIGVAFSGPASPTFVGGQTLAHMAAPTQTIGQPAGSSSLFAFAGYPNWSGFDLGGANYRVLFQFDFIIQNGVNTGAFAFVWGPKAAGTSPDTRLAGSYMEYQVV
jgi:hypothetical protein